MLSLWNHLLHIGQAHGVNPGVFAVLYLIHHPLFWGTFALIVVRVRQHRPYKLLAVLATCFWFLPYVYVVLFGRGLPWWVYVLLLAAIAVGAPHALRQMRQRLHQRE